MNTAGDLIDFWRSDVSDAAQPYFWSDDSALVYADAAYKMFVRLTGGITDFISDACTVAVTAGEVASDLHHSILRIHDARLASTGRNLKIANLLDPIGGADDYGKLRSMLSDTSSGPVHTMVIGVQRHKARWVNVPVADDEVQLSISRLPLTSLTVPESTMNEVDEIHHPYLIDWMKHLAYKKQDADTFDRERSDRCAKDFEAYCALVKRELAREQHKTRVTTYGGL